MKRPRLVALGPIVMAVWMILGAAPSSRAPEKGELFSEVTGAVGLVEKPPIYPDGRYMTPEITPGGVALLDFDNDGLLDILVICHPPPQPYPEMVKATAPNRLFRQTHDGKFVEVPGAAGLAGKGFHHGVAVGDVNNDGFPDVYVCNYGSGDELFLNNGDGTFRDVTDTCGINATPLSRSEKNWSSTAAFFDYDGDGHLDLYVAHFATFDPNKRCADSDQSNDVDYCGPHQFPGQLGTLYHNKGDGTFEDVTAKVGIDAPGRGWGLICADLTGDGRADIFQANDEEPNQLWVQQDDGRFVDEAVLRGCAFNAAGSVEANMGVAIGDVRNTGGLDLFSTHITSETNTLWADQGSGNWLDVTANVGMAIIDRPFTGWGCGFFDFDNDGKLDLAVVNGRVAKGPARSDADVGNFWNRYAEPNLLFRGDGTGKFADVSREAGAFTRRLEVTRALAFADLSNRGAIDLVTVSLANNVRVYRNNAAANGGHWLQVLPKIGKRDAIGARVTITVNGQKRAALCLRNYSYLAANDPRVHFGLGAADHVDSIEVAWPGGAPRREKFVVPDVDRDIALEQGKGEAIASPANASP